MTTQALLNMGIKQPGCATGKWTAYVSLPELGFVKHFSPQQDQLFLGCSAPEQQVFASCLCQLWFLLWSIFRVTAGSAKRWGFPDFP